MNKNIKLMLVPAAAMLLLAGCGDSGVNPPGGNNVQAVSSSALQAMFERHNNERNSQGEFDLSVDQRLNAIARDQARFMAVQDNLTHSGPEISGHDPNNSHSSDVSERADAENYNWNVIGENIAFAQSGQSAFNLWLDSNDHYANIIDDDYTEIGIGAYENAFGQYWCVVFGDE